ncbi:MAG: FhaA domain-containing protein [Ktedonobacteraceae bacterium]
MSARQNPLSKFEELMERLIENPFGVLFPSKIEPTELARKLQRSMDKGLLIQGGNHRLAPNVYDIYLSIADHQNLVPSQVSLIKEWQKSLIDYAIARHYTLKIVPIIRLHADSKLRLGFARIDAKVEDTRNINAGGGGGGGVEATQALSAEQLALLRAQLMPGQELPGIASSSPNQVRAPIGGPGSSPAMPPMPPVQPAAPPMPPAKLIIQLPQAGQQIYRIEKPIINIGRQLSNDIIVEDKRVSRNHAQIKYQAGQFTLFDLGSTNGVTISTNGVSITIKANSATHSHQHILRTGDRFTIGSYEFYFERR